MVPTMGASSESSGASRSSPSPGSPPRDGGEERFRALAEHATELLIELAADGRAIYASPSARELLGYPPEALVGRDLLDFIHEDDRGRVAREYAPLLESERRASSLHRVWNADGTLRWMQDTARSYRDASGSIRIVIVARDVTDQRRAEDELAEQLQIQECVAELSRRFLALPASEIEEALREELGVAAVLARADATRLHVMGARDRPAIHTVAWYAPGVPPAAPPSLGGARRRFAWSAGRLLAGEVVHVSRVDDLPPEAAAEREDMRARGVRSTLAIPIASGDATRGFQVFECTREERRWSDREITAVRMVGEIFARALERQRAEAALRESEERYRAIAENATELVAELDENGRALYASPSFERLLGHRPADLEGRIAAPLVHPDDLPASVAVFREAMRTGNELHAIHRVRHASGEWRWIDVSGRIYRTAAGETRMVSTGRDITDRKSLAEAVERQLEVERRVAGLSRRLLGLTGEGLEAALRDALRELAELGGADRCYLFLMEGPYDRRSPLLEWCGEGIGAYRGSGWHPWSHARIRAGETVRATRLDELPPQAYRERASFEARGVVSLLHIPLRFGERTGGVIGFESMREERPWSEQQVTVLRLCGEILLSAVRRDRAEGALRESQQQLHHAQKLEAVGRLAGGIAHDFNNLLTVILGFCRPLLREVGPDTELHDDLEEIHKAAQRAAALTRQLLTFSRRQNVEAGSVDPGAMLRGLQPLLRHLLEEDVELVFDLDPAAGSVNGDVNQLEQVVINLAVNARDAMPDGGTLHIRTRAETFDVPRAAATGRVAGDPAVCLSVIDSGLGMDAETRARIFDPFFTTKDPGKGTGLGLSIAYSVVEQCGGLIEVEGGPGKGTAFHLWLPRVEAGEPGAAPTALAAPPRAEGVRVLLVEDEAAVRRLARRILGAHGYEVVEAVDGAHALEVLEGLPGPIHALVSDVVMPRLGGVELARRLRARQPELPVLLLSGHPRDAADLSDLEPACMLPKPFSEEALLEELGRLVGDGADPRR